jgi:hypothetical protein
MRVEADTRITHGVLAERGPGRQDTRILGSGRSAEMTCNKNCGRVSTSLHIREHEIQDGTILED